MPVTRSTHENLEAVVEALEAEGHTLVSVTVAGAGLIVTTNLTAKKRAQPGEKETR